MLEGQNPGGLVQRLNKEAESLSMKRCASECLRKIDAGHPVSTAPSIVFFMACRLAGPGTIANSFGRAMIVGIVSDRA